MVPLILACSALPPEGSTSSAECVDGFDNDQDGRLDCADPDCSGQTVCEADTGDTGDTGDQPDSGVLVADMARFWPQHQSAELHYLGDEDEGLLRVETEGGFTVWSFQGGETEVGWTLSTDGDGVWLHAFTGPEVSLELDEPVLWAPREILPSEAWDATNGEVALFAFAETMLDCEAGELSGDCVFLVIEGDGGLEVLSGEWLLLEDVGPTFMGLHHGEGNWELTEMSGG